MRGMVENLFIYLFIIYLFIKTSFAWVTKLSVNTVFQFGPGVKHNTKKKKKKKNLLTQRKDII